MVAKTAGNSLDSHKLMIQQSDNSGRQVATAQEPTRLRLRLKVSSRHHLASPRLLALATILRTQLLQLSSHLKLLKASTRCNNNNNNPPTANKPTTARATHMDTLTTTAHINRHMSTNSRATGPDTEDQAMPAVKAGIKESSNRPATCMVALTATVPPTISIPRLLLMRTLSAIISVAPVVWARSAASRIMAAVLLDLGRINRAVAMAACMILSPVRPPVSVRRALTDSRAWLDRKSR